MNITLRTFVAALGLFGTAGLVSAAPMGALDNPVQTPESVIEKWPAYSKAAAKALIVKYGEPDDFSAGALVWLNNAPWKKTVVYRDAPRREGVRAEEILEQTISYQVPKKKAAALKRFDPRVTADRIRGELSSLSSSENLNFLALNLADEIVSGRRSADEARAFFLKTEELSRSGKSSSYLGGFRFEVLNERAIIP